jgi:hypothetical protein
MTTNTQSDRKTPWWLRRVFVRHEHLQPLLYLMKTVASCRLTYVTVTHSSHPPTHMAIIKKMIFVRHNIFFKYFPYRCVKWIIFIDITIKQNCNIKISCLTIISINIRQNTDTVLYNLPILQKWNCVAVFNFITCSTNFCQNCNTLLDMRKTTFLLRLKNVGHLNIYNRRIHNEIIKWIFPLTH